MTMIEKVAKAIYESRNGKGCAPWSHMNKAYRECYILDASAALKAMREPTEGMVKAAGETEGMRDVDAMVINHQVRTGVRLKWDTSPLTQAWHAAIDAAIAEHQSAP